MALSRRSTGRGSPRAINSAIPGTFVGLLFVSVTVSGLTLFGVEAWVQPVFTGGALVAAVLIAHWFQKLATKDH